MKLHLNHLNDENYDDLLVHDSLNFASFGS